MLMLTFIAIIRYQASEEALAKNYEKSMHAFAISIVVMTGIVLVTLDAFDPFPALGLQRCYIAAYPPDCDLIDTSTCTRAPQARFYLIALAIVPGLMVLAVLLASLYDLVYSPSS